jgi:uncharacterized protein YraI
MGLFSSMSLRVAALALLLAPATAFASVTRTTGNVNLREGPGTEHRVIVTIPAGSSVNIHSCGTTWCYLSWTRHSGFSSRRYLSPSTATSVAPSSSFCRAYARDYSLRYSAGGAMGGVVRGALGGAVIGGIANGTPGRGASIGAGVGGVSRGLQRSALYDRAYADCMRGRWP